MTYRSVFRPGLLEGQVVLVTGGGSGIGRCTAHELSSLGAAVALMGRTGDKLRRVEEEISAAGGTAAGFVGDIREEAVVDRTVAAVLERFRRIDGLVNNAGGQFQAPLATISQKGWETVVRNNLTGGFLMARSCYNQWMSANGGAIVNVVADFWNGMPGMGHSGAARAGMVNFTETAALEWSAANVRVNAVAPGWIASNGLDSYPPEVQQRIRRLAGTTPLGRFGTESEISAAIVFLLSEGARFISGTTLRVDGAVPNHRRNSFQLAERTGPSPEFNGFHLAAKPKLFD